MSPVRCGRCGGVHAYGICPDAVESPLAGAIAGAAGAGRSGRRASLVGAPLLEGKYRVVDLIASGGTSDVYEAVHQDAGRVVAIKALHRRRAGESKAVARFLQEASVAATLKHPNVCEVIDLGRLPDGRPFLVMERLVGETLAARIAREGLIAPRELVLIMTDLLAGLGAVHQRGAVHRDLKPANVFLAARPNEPAQAKLLDFGVAKLSSRDQTPITTVGAIVGTAMYMSPEHITGKRKIDWLSDIWSVGVIMYEALTGRPPFWSPKRPALLHQITTVPHRPLADIDPTIPSELAAIVDKALAKDPAGRHSSAGELRRTLLELLQSALRVQPPPLPTSAPPTRSAPAAGEPDIRVGRSGLPVLDLDQTTEETMAFALMPNRVRRSTTPPPVSVGAPPAPGSAAPGRSTTKSPAKAPPRREQEPGPARSARSGPPPLPVPRPSNKGR